ncbi:MAG: glycosyltransferase [Eubacteriales bacterium]|nr:glycosyltransferase [Eubacteriales bacterium]
MQIQNKKIKILEMFGEPISFGGQEQVVYNMITVLKNENFHFDLFTPYFVDNNIFYNLIKNNKNEFQNGDIFSLNLEFKNNDNRFKLKNDINKFFKNHHDYDIVHIHTGSLSTMCLFSKLSKKYNIKKVIVHSHCAGEKESVIHKLQKRILNFMLQKYANYYLSCSQSAATWKYTHKALKENIIVYNGIDINLFKYNEEYRNEIREKFNLNNKFVIGMVGRIDYQKNQTFSVDLIYELLKYNHNIVLFMIGDGKDKQKIINQIKEKNIQEKIIMINKINDIYKYYNAFDLFILPSLFEGLGIVAVEAQLNKLPCIISNNIERLVQISSATCFLSLNNKKDWVNLILKIKENKNHQYDRSNIIVDNDKFDKNNTFDIIRRIYLK